MNEENREIYKQLDQPLPIQNKQPIKTKSLFDFVCDQPGELKQTITEGEELYKVSQQYFISKKNIHQIGDNLSVLFKQPIYKTHQLINTSNNYVFGSCKTNQNGRLDAEHKEYPVRDQQLEFQSRFQSGNLAMASGSVANKSQYFLALQRDINAESITTQWFYFRVRNRSNLGPRTFHIVNFVKPFSMFKVGMKPCVYSVKHGKGWERAGINLEYRKNSISYEEQRFYYSLSFTYDFTLQDDEVFFAYCYPYTYTRLQKFLEGIQVKHSDKMRRKTIAKTIGDNAVEMVLITNPRGENKKAIFISARVHPGETVGSFSCEAMILFLLSSHSEAQKMRNQFIIKIIPMLNPDGVISGNYRTSLSGQDLNRKWKYPSQTKHPEIFHAKNTITETEYKKLLYIDIHGHSKKKSSFMYGCINTKYPYAAKELPYILSKNMQNFSYWSSNFSTPKSKEGTSRIALWKTGIDYSYTYQLSFCGPQREKRHFNIRDYQTIGVQLSLSLCKYFYCQVLDLEKNEEIMRHCEEFYHDEQLLNMGADETNGSSSELEDQVVKELIKPPPKTERLGLRRHSTAEKSNYKDINHILQNYLSKYNNKEVHSKIDNQFKNYPQERKKVEADKQVYMRHRQSFMATKVNIQQMALQDHLFTSMSTFYGLASDKPMESANSSILKHSTPPNNHSFSFTDRRLEKSQESYGLLLPNVQKGQYKRYQRYKKGKSSKSEERTVPIYVQTAVQQNAFNQMHTHRNSYSQPSRNKKEVSLVQRLRSRTNDKRDYRF